MRPLFSLVQELLLLGPIPILIVVNVADAGVERRRPAVWLGVHVTRSVARVVITMIPALLGLLGLMDLIAGAVSGPARQAQPGILLTGAGLVVLAALLTLLLFPGLMRMVARVLPLDPESVTSQAALVMAIAVIGTQVITQVTTDVLAEATRTGRQLSRLDLLAGEIPFLIVAVIGTGFLTRRGPSATVRRLGLNLPPLWVISGGLAAAIFFLGFGMGADWAAHELTPALAKRVDAANSSLFGGLGDPFGVLTIAIAAGVCEEVLFRGAIQPRLGLILTSVLFASVHSQYGLSFDALAVLVLAVGLGLIRKAGGTTVAIVAHVAYDALVGAGLTLSAWPWLAGAVAVLLALFGAGLGRRRASLTRAS